MDHNDRGIPSEELATIAQRVARVLGRFDAMPFHALQYRLGEAGQRRINARVLRRALQELSKNKRPRRGAVGMPGPREPLAGIYVSAETSRPEAKQSAVAAMAQLHQFTGLDWDMPFDQLCSAVSGAAGCTEIITDSMPDPRTAYLAGDLHLPIRTRVARISEKRAPITYAWITHEPEWLFPDDPQLWEFLELCARDNARALVVARIIDQTTFAIFKALGIRGLQYYSTLVGASDFVLASSIAQNLGWAHILPVETLSEHRMINQIDPALAHLRETVPPDGAREKIAQAVACGLTEPNATSTQKLLDWARDTHLDLPKVWTTAVRRWTEMNGYRIPRRSEPTEGVSYVEMGEGITEKSQPRRQLKRKQDRNAPDAPEETVPWGFGRKTVVERVPFPLR